MSMRRLLRVPDVRTYLVGQAFSLFGDSALWLAMGIWVKSLTGSSGAAGLVFFFFTAPALLGPLAGLLVDRVRRRPLLIVVNAGAGLAVLLLLLVDRAAEVWLVYLVMALYGIAYTVLASAQAALLTTIVPAGLLPDANGALRTIQETLRLVGPLLGSALFLLGGAHVVVVLDALTFVVPVVCLLRLRVREPEPRPATAHWVGEVTAGVRFIGGSGVLRPVVLAAACALCVFGFSETTIFAVVGQGLHRPPAFVGVLGAVQGAGAVLGGPSAAPLVRRIGEARLLGAGMLVGAAGALLQVPSFLPSVLAGTALFGISVPWMVVGFTTLLQRSTPDHLQGRVYAAASTIVTVPQTVSIALGAGLIGLVGYRGLLAAMAVVIALAAGRLLARAPRVSTVGQGPVNEPKPGGTAGSTAE